MPSIPNPSLRVVAVYVACGLLFGFIFLPLIPLVRVLGLPRDSSVGIALFGLMPLLIVVLGLSYPRLLINLLGLTLAISAWAVGYAAACRLNGSGSISYNLVIMATWVVLPYFALALLVHAVAFLRRTSRRGA